MWKTGALGRNLISNVSAKPVLKYQRHYRGFTSQPKHESTGLMEGAIQNLISKFCLHLQANYSNKIPLSNYITATIFLQILFKN